MTADSLPTVDGRRARRDQNRDRVVDALLDLYREGDLEPSVNAVAERSGVSHRSVFRYFDDLDELYRVAIERQYQTLRVHLLISEIGRGTLLERIDRIVANRLDLYEVAAPVARVGHMKAPLEPILLDHLRDNAQESIIQVRRHFADELAAMTAERSAVAAEAITLVLSMESMETMLFIRGLSRDQAAACMRMTLTGILGAADG